MKSLLCVLACIPVFGLLSHAADSHYDGRWWNEASDERQVGFLSGESACYQYDLLLQSRNLRSNYQAQKLLNAYYSREEKLSVSIQAAIAEVSKNLKPYVIEQAEGAQAYPEKYGYYDELWWRGGDAKGEQLGFIEGYVSCLPNGRKLFPKPFESYVAKITKWYEDNPESSDEKIPVVLQKISVASR